MSTFQRQASYHCGSPFLRPKGFTRIVRTYSGVERQRTDGIAHVFLHSTCVQGRRGCARGLIDVVKTIEKGHYI